MSLDTRAVAQQSTKEPTFDFARPEHVNHHREGHSHEAPRNTGKHRFTLTVVALSLAAVILSTAGSWIPSFWGDEAASIMSAERPLPSLMRMLGSVDAVHGTYYFGLHWWISWFGTSPFVVRLPSAFAIGCTVAGVMIIGKQLQSTRIAVIAGIFCTLLPRISYIGEETRSYAFSAAIATWLTIVLIQLVRRQRPGLHWWLAYGVLLTVGIYVFLYLALLIIAHVVVLVSSKVGRRQLALWFAASTAAVVSASPVIVYATLERNQIEFLDTRDMISIGNVLIRPWFGIWPFAVLGWLLIACAAFATITRNGALPHRDLSEATELPRLDIVAITWMFIPIAILVFIFPWLPIFTPRYLSFCAPAVAILMAIGVDWVVGRRRWTLVAGVSLVVLLAAPIYVAQRTPNALNNSDWQQISVYIGQHSHVGDAIVFDEAVRPSRRPRLAMRTYPDGFTKVKDVTLAVPFMQSTLWHDSAYTVAEAAKRGRLADVKRLWLIEYALPTHTDEFGRKSLNRLGFSVIAVHRTHRSAIYEYVRPLNRLRS